MSLPSVKHDDSIPTIEPASPDDAPAINALVAASYTKYISRMGKPPAPMLQDYHTLIPSQNIYVLRLNHQLVGSIYVRVDREGGSMKVRSLVVDPSMQGRGYGRLLMGFAEDLARERGVDAVELFTNVMMWENVAMYEKLGFGETGRRTEEGFERVFFRKKLNGL